MISTYVLDTARGLPAPRLPVQLDVFITGHGWREAGHGVTDQGGRIADFGEPPAAGIYRLMYDIAAYNPRSFFPSIAVTFDVEDAGDHYHMPLVLSPFSYITYRET
jgi:5-hydroxyisourate hydrolase